jgi:hypothetical protein
MRELWVLGAYRNEIDKSLSVLRGDAQISK